MAERWINHGAQPGWAQALTVGRVIEEKSLAWLTRSVMSASRSRHFSNMQTKSVRLTKV
jgi:hypothetical protein